MDQRTKWTQYNDELPLRENLIKLKKYVAFIYGSDEIAIKRISSERWKIRYYDNVNSNNLTLEMTIEHLGDIHKYGQIRMAELSEKINQEARYEAELLKKKEEKSKEWKKMKSEIRKLYKKSKRNDKIYNSLIYAKYTLEEMSKILEVISFIREHNLQSNTYEELINLESKIYKLYYKKANSEKKAEFKSDYDRVDYMDNSSKHMRVLGIECKSEIKKAHRRLIKEFHPDTGGCVIKFREIQEAYEYLK